MNPELVYRMRTCSAALLDSKGMPSPKLIFDTAQALIEASNLLDVPMEVMEVLPTPTRSEPSIAAWVGTDLPTVSPRPCPSCGSIDARKAKIVDRHVRLTCPKCIHQWEI